MPFVSEEQRRYLWANEPDIARRWAGIHTYGAADQYWVEIDPTKYPSAYKTINSQMARLARMYPNGAPTKVTVGKTTIPGAYAETNSIAHTIVFDEKWFGESAYKQTAARMRAEAKMGWFSGDGSVESTLSHEFGHHLTVASMGRRDWVKLNRAIDKQVHYARLYIPGQGVFIVHDTPGQLSLYAMASPYERAAEAYAQALHPNKTRDVPISGMARVTKEYLDKTFGPNAPLAPINIPRTRLILGAQQQAPNVAGRLQPMVKAYTDYNEVLNQMQQSAIRQQEFLKKETPTGRPSMKPINQVTKRIRQDLLKIEVQNRRWMTKQVPLIFSDSVKNAQAQLLTAGVKDVGFTLDAQDAKFIQDEINHLNGQLNRAHIQTINEATRFLKDVQRGEHGVQGRVKVPGSKAGQFVVDRYLRLHGVKSIEYSDGKRYNIRDFTKMQLQASNSRITNYAMSRVAAKKEHYLIVHDSPECGWTRHEDPDKKAGDQILPREAAAYPISHPNCVRRFSIGPELRPRDKLREKNMAQKAAEAILIAGAAGVAARTAIALAKSQRIQEMYNEMRIAALHGSPIFQYFNSRINALKNIFAAGRPPAEVIPFPGTFPPSWDEPAVVNATMKAVDRNVRAGVPLPPAVRSVLGIGDGESLARQYNKMKAFANYEKIAHHLEVDTETLQKLADVIEMEARRRNLTNFNIVLSRINTEIRGAWTKYGPRIRADITEFLKVSVSKTKEGFIKAATFKPVPWARGVIRMMEDGSLAGHISLIPRGPFRAIFEVDEYGKLKGNIRLIPGGRFKVYLEMKMKGLDLRALPGTPEAISLREQAARSVDRAWGARERARERLSALEQLIAGPESRQAIVQSSEYQMALARFKLADEAYVRRFQHLRDMMGFDFDINQPRFKDLFHDLRQMEFNRVIVEYRAIRQGPLDLSMRLEMPVAEIKRWLRHPLNSLLAASPDGTYTGLFRYEKSELLEDLSKLAQRVKVTGSLRFAQFKTDAKVVWDYRNAELQNIAMNLRVRGHNVFDIANIVGAKVEDVVKGLNESRVRLLNWMNYLGIGKPGDISPVFAARLHQAELNYSDARNKTRGQIIRAAVDRMSGRRKSGGPTGILRTLAGIDRTDTPAVAERKLLALREFLRVDQVDQPELTTLLKQIGRGDLRRAATDLTKGINVSFGPGAAAVGDLIRPTPAYWLHVNDLVQSIIMNINQGGEAFRARVLSLNEHILAWRRRFDPKGSWAYGIQLAQIWAGAAKTIVKDVVTGKMQMSDGVWWLTSFTRTALHDMSMYKENIYDDLGNFTYWINPKYFPSARTDVENAARKINTLYPNGPHVALQIDALPRGTAGRSVGDGSIHLNINMWREGQRQRLERWIKSHIEKGSNAGDGSPESIIMHEYGHHMWYGLTDDQRRELLEQIDYGFLKEHPLEVWRQLGSYANVNERELISEALSQYHYPKNGNFPGMISMRVGVFFDKVYGPGKAARFVAGAEGVTDRGIIGSLASTADEVVDVSFVPGPPKIRKFNQTLDREALSIIDQIKDLAHRHYPRADMPRFRMIETWAKGWIAQTRGFFTSDPRQIELNANYWASENYQKLIDELSATEKQRRIKHWFSHDLSPDSLVIHEYEHHLHNLLTDKQEIELQQRIASVPGYEWINRGWNIKTQGRRTRILQDLGTYASWNWDEFLAEALAQYHLPRTGEPSEVSKVVGLYYSEVFGK